MTNSVQPAYDAVILGAGFFGLRIAQHLRERGMSRVLVVEAEAEAMSRASYVNQARVHNGYHYPRSILTAFRSRISSRQFAEEYAPAMETDFEHVYAISAQMTKTNAKQFESFCGRIGASLSPVPAEIAAEFSPRLIEKSWLVEEFAFNSRILRSLVLDQLRGLGGIEIRYESRAQRVAQGRGTVEVMLDDGTRVAAPLVISSLYSGVNVLHSDSGLSLLPLQHELTEMALVRMPVKWRQRALTVMDGPFFSLMPFPDEGLHTFSHVRYTPQIRWEDSENKSPRRVGRDLLAAHTTTFREMKADLQRYVSGMEELEYVKSIREVKTVLAKNDLTDSRPIVVKTGLGIDGYYCVLGGKMDNVGDVIEELTYQLGL